MQPTTDTGDIFTKPSIKLFCKQLKECQQLNVGSHNKDCWVIPLRNSSTSKEVRAPVYTVWLQGTIHSIINKSNVILKDSSGGIAKIVECEKVAGGCDWMQQGLYCAIVGVLVSSNHTPVVRAIKMNPLENANNLQLMWDWEIKDLADYLTSH